MFSSDDERRSVTDLDSSRGWWREPALALLIVLVASIYFSRLTTLTIRGEESRWARVAIEMMESGDWIVPRQQGEVFLSRPPLGSWLIALSIWWHGSCDAWAVRFPMAMATLLTAVLVYAYSRRFMSSAGALAAGAGYATMGQVLELGRLAETEAILTFLVGASLLLWHWGYHERWPAWTTWTAGYGLAALASLAKGPQGPVYFVAVVFAYLILVRRDWRFLVSRAHALGIAVFAVVLGVWQVPFLLATDWDAVVRIWTSDAAARFLERGWLDYLEHAIAYPAEVWASMLPWSFLLIAYAWPSFRRALGRARPNAVFLVTAIAVTFPSVLAAVDARNRYYMPLYPCFAPLIGLVVERYLANAWEEGLAPRRWLFACGQLGALVIFMAGMLIFVASTLLRDALPTLAQPIPFAILYAGASTVLACALAWANRSVGRDRAWVGVVAITCSMGLTYTGVVVNSLVRTSENTPLAVARLKEQLPPDAELVSLAGVHHLFAYHYGSTIPTLPFPNEQSPPQDDCHYFCVHLWGGRPAELPFRWEPVAVISCDRNRNPHPYDRVVVGRRLTDAEVVARTSRAIEPQ